MELERAQRHQWKWSQAHFILRIGSEKSTEKVSYFLSGMIWFSTLFGSRTKGAHGIFVLVLQDCETRLQSQYTEINFSNILNVLPKDLNLSWRTNPAA